MIPRSRLIQFRRLTDSPGEIFQVMAMTLLLGESIKVSSFKCINQKLCKIDKVY